MRYVRWRPQTGVNGALASARRFLADEPVLVGPADALHREPIHPHIATFAADRLDAMALSPAGAPQGVGGEPVAGGYLFSPRGVAALLERPRSLQDPLTLVRARGGQVRVQPIDGCLACHGGQERLLEGNRRMLESLVASVDRKAHPTAEFQGAVAIHPTARVEHTLIRGPAVIGPRATLSHAYIGPYTAIGADVHIEGTHIEHSIVLDGAELLHVGSQLETSVIGRGARIGRNFGLPAAMRLSIGDGAEVTLS